MKLLILALCVTIAQQLIAEKDKLQIEILYESLCPDSLNFIQNQLTPSYKDLTQYTDITFVPFGKSYSTAEGFECQHGPAECQGNRIQSCVLSALKDQHKKVQYVNCFMISYNKNPSEYGQKCAEQVGIQWNFVTQCFQSKMGTQLQLEAENVTSQYSPTFIPTVVYDKEFDQEAQDDSMVGFRSYICTRLQKTYPDACPVIEYQPISEELL